MSRKNGIETFFDKVTVDLCSHVLTKQFNVISALLPKKDLIYEMMPRYETSFLLTPLENEDYDWPQEFLCAAYIEDRNAFVNSYRRLTIRNYEDDKNDMKIDDILGSQLLEFEKDEKSFDFFNKYLGVSRTHSYNASLAFRVVNFTDKSYKERYKNGFVIKGNLFEAPRLESFVETPPSQINFLVEPKLVNIFWGFYNYSNTIMPFYRVSNRYSRQVNNWGIVVDKKIYPPSKILANASDSRYNNDYLEILNKCFNIEESNINQFNFALDTNSSIYLCRKLAGNKSILILPYFKKNKFREPLDANFNVFVRNPIFDPTNEIIGKAIYGVNIGDLSDKLEEE
jgi:hypothetical protein